MSSRAFLVICEDCPPYDPVVGMVQSVRSRRKTDRRGKGAIGLVNQATDFTDNMWCRRGEQATPGEVAVRGVRVNGS